MFIQRSVVGRIEKAIKRKEIIALVGARQVGKTTIMKHFFDKIKTEKSHFITFDDLDILNLFEKNTEIFIERYVKGKDFLFIDEIQYSKNSGKILKYIFDTNSIKIFISGSSKSEIAIQSLQHLVGRVLIFEAYPLSLKNVIDFSKKENSFLFEKKRKNKDFEIIKKNFSEYLIFGGYPEVFLESSKDLKKEILRNIKNTYLLKEIRDILNYKSLGEFESILKILSVRDGNILNKNSISSDIGIHNNKIKEIIDVLEKTTILNIVRPILKNKSKELIKSPKTYLFDLGFKNSLLENYNSLELRQDRGAIYENFILNSMVKEGLSVNYWNYKNLNEVDFVVSSNKGLFGFEVKSKVSKGEISSSIKRFIDGHKPKKVYVFCENCDDIKKYGGCEVEFTSHLNVFWIIENILK